ncbi:hypothetical protein JYU14_03685 [Simkania negevensis]|uniref:Uncharacterized protein n=1 Tax=Simkania negevensis TaxID=83561 RepID=A0ABS3ASR0_9BACT|nr:hypothetical protein [Simkania negevensis]
MPVIDQQGSANLEGTPPLSSSEKATSPFLQHKKTIVITLLIVLVLFFATLYLLAHNKTEREETYYEIENTLQSYRTRRSPETLLNLASLIASTPSAQAKYNPLLAQAFLNSQLNNKAIPYAQSALQRTDSQWSSLFGSFSTTSLTIAQEHYQHALDQALATKKSLETLPTPPTQLPYYNALYAYTLLRIAFLQQALNDNTAELASWNALLSYQNLLVHSTQTDPSTTFRNITQAFNTQFTNLHHYIQHRIKILNNV